MGQPRPRTLGLAFGTFFAAVFLLAWNTASSLTTPWYGPDLSRWVYMAFLIASAGLIAGLGATATIRASYFDRRIAELERVAPRQSEPATRPVRVPAPAVEVKDKVDQDIDELLTSLSVMEGGVVEEEEVEASVVEPESGEETAPTASANAALAALRSQLQRRRRNVVRYAMGPSAVAVAFLGISGALLPGADVFLQSFHQLNTALVLGIAYSWIGLGIYAMASIVAILKDG